jgi:hypothetical protein
MRRRKGHASLLCWLADFHQLKFARANVGPDLLDKLHPSAAGRETRLHLLIPSIRFLPAEPRGKRRSFLCGKFGDRAFNGILLYATSQKL